LETNLISRGEKQRLKTGGRLKKENYVKQGMVEKLSLTKKFTKKPQGRKETEYLYFPRGFGRVGRTRLRRGICRGGAKDGHLLS